METRRLCLTSVVSVNHKLIIIDMAQTLLLTQKKEQKSMEAINLNYHKVCLAHKKGSSNTSQLLPIHPKS